MRLVVLALLLALSPTVNAAKKDLTVAESYELGQKYAKRGYYVKALEEFNRIRNYHRDDPFAVKAELAIADVYFKKAEWDQARVAYEDFMRMHPRHEDLHYVIYRLGLTAWKKAPRIAARDQTWTRQALNAWSPFASRYQSSDESAHFDEVMEYMAKCEARLAHKELIIGRFYLRQESWLAAASRMETLLQRYPDAPDAPDALGELAWAHHELGDTDLASEVAQRLRTDHPDHRAVDRLERRAPGL